MSLRAKFGRCSVRAPSSPHRSVFRRVLSGLLVAVLLAASLAVQPRGVLADTSAATSAGHLNYADTDRGDAQALPREPDGIVVAFRPFRPTPAGPPDSPDISTVPDAAPDSGPSRRVSAAFPSTVVRAGPSLRPYHAQAPPSRARA